MLASCDRVHFCRGYCKGHHDRWYRTGDPMEAKPLATRARHGGARTRLYDCWAAMKSRCSNPKHPNYHRYGGRGITVCPEWQTFPPFRDWALSHGYTDELTIDRVNNDGNYEPANCEWVTQSENSIRLHQQKETTNAC